MRRTRERKLAVLVFFTHDEEFADLAGLEHIAQAFHPVDRHLLQRHEGSRLGADIDHCALGFQGEDGAVDDVARLEVVVVLAQQRGEFINGESGVIKIAAAGSAARIISSWNVFWDAEILGGFEGFINTGDSCCGVLAGFFAG